MVCDHNATTQLTDMVAGEGLFIQCVTQYKGLWAPVIEFSDNVGTIYNPTNSTTDMVVEYSISFTVAPEDTGRTMEAHMQFGDVPDGALPPSDDANTWASNVPDLTASETFDPLVV